MKGQLAFFFQLIPNFYPQNPRKQKAQISPVWWISEFSLISVMLRYICIYIYTKISETWSIYNVQNTTMCNLYNAIKTRNSYPKQPKLHFWVGEVFCVCNSDLSPQPLKSLIFQGVLIKDIGKGDKKDEWAGSSPRTLSQYSHMYFIVKDGFCKLFKLSKVATIHSCVPKCCSIICCREEMRSNSFGPENVCPTWNGSINLPSKQQVFPPILTPPHTTLERTSRKYSFVFCIYWLCQMVICL